MVPSVDDESSLRPAARFGRAISAYQHGLTSTVRIRVARKMRLTNGGTRQYLREGKAFPNLGRKRSPRVDQASPVASQYLRTMLKEAVERRVSLRSFT
jgi:hypothetical protein